MNRLHHGPKALRVTMDSVELRAARSVRVLLGFVMLSLAWGRAPTLAETPHLVSNINEQPIDEASAGLGRLGDDWLLVANTPGSGRELWKASLDRPYSAVRLKDIRVGSASSLPLFEREAARLGDSWLFVADDGITGSELWKTDGTESGTVLVKDLEPGPQSSYPRGLVTVGGQVFFVIGGDLWKSDGTADGTVRVKALRSGALTRPIAWGSGVAFGANVGEDAGLWRSDGTADGTLQLISLTNQFVADTAGRVVEGRWYQFSSTNSGLPSISLWVSDGTPAGTSLVRFGYGGSLGDLAEIPAQDGKLFFSQFFHSSRLWVSDGTSAGTRELGPRSYRASRWVGSTLYVSGLGANGSELWRTDGTPEGTRLLKSFARPADDSSALNNLSEVGGVLVFQAYDAEAGFELWRSDGTPEGTRRIADLVPGPTSSRPSTFLEADGGLLFRAMDADGTAALWKTDGTAAGTARIGVLHAGDSDSTSALVGHARLKHSSVLLEIVVPREDTPTSSALSVWVIDGGEAAPRRLLRRQHSAKLVPSMVLQTDEVAVFATYSPSGRVEYWRTDGTSSGTFPLGPDAMLSDQGSSPGVVATYQHRGFFVADDGFHGRQVWSTDGTESGTTRVSDFPRLPGGETGLQSVVATTAALYCYRITQEFDELWVSDGTAATLRRIAALPPGVLELTPVGDRLYFRSGSRELWVSDGTESGTRKLRTFEADAVDPFRPSVVSLTPAGASLFFSAYEPETGLELWRSDGTDAGTRRVKDQTPGPRGSEIPARAAFQEGILFFVGETNFTHTLWRSDGTEVGTFPLRTFDNSPNGFEASPLVVAHGEAFFSDYDPEAGAELWKTDGTPAGTQRVKDVTPGTGGSDPYRMTAVGDRLFFRMKLPGRIHPLWVTDGTDAGTCLVKSDMPVSSYYYYSSVSANGILYFLETGSVWRSDGTEQGTYAILDSVSGSRNFFGVFGSPLGTELTALDGMVLLAADDGFTGPELWRVGQIDRNGNGLPDAWETRYFQNPPDPLADPDGDGLTNLAEAEAGTDPGDPVSALRVTMVVVVGPGVVMLEWASRPGVEYRVVRFDSWTGARVTLESRVRATPPINTWFDGDAPRTGASFYQVVVE